MERALKKGADPNKRQPEIKRYVTALESVGLAGTFKISGKTDNECDFIYKATKLLLKYGADPNRVGTSALFWPISNGCGATVELLLKNGANPVRRTSEGTPMEWAVQYEKPKIQKILAKYGAIKFDDKDVLQLQLTQAASAPNPYKVKTLIKYGAKVNLPDKRNRTALMVVCRYGISH